MSVSPFDLPKNPLHTCRAQREQYHLALSLEILESKRDAERRVIDRADGVAGWIDVVVEELGHDIFTAFRGEQEGRPLWR